MGTNSHVLPPDQSYMERAQRHASSALDYRGENTKQLFTYRYLLEEGVLDRFGLGLL